MELRTDEQPLYEGRPAWRALLSFYLSGLIAALALGAIVWLAASEAAGVAVGIGVAVLVLVVGYVRRLFTKYLITTRRLRITRGIIRRQVQETRLDRVQNVNYEQGVIDRMLKVGSVDFDTAGTDDSEFRFEWVNGPEDVVRAVDRAIADATSRPSEPLPPPPA
ncbi:MAG TPA: PH domain-containing protein [Thermoleophilaceae bacterium]|nr:PH domain-containing protein [Thermoleophilaceae bacterium]